MLYIAVTQAAYPYSCLLIFFNALSLCHLSDLNQLNSMGRILSIYWDLSYPQRLKMTATFFILYWVFPLFLQVPGDMLRKAIGFSFSQSAYKSEDRFSKSLVRLFCINVCSRFSPIFFYLQSGFKMVHLTYVRVLACVEHLPDAHNTAKEDELYTHLFAART